MKPVVKIAIVVAGYLFAVFGAWAAVALNAALSRVPDDDASGGMHAFGDLLLFVVAFGVLALIPTGAAIFFLRSKIRPHRQAVEPTAGMTERTTTPEAASARPRSD